MNAELEANTVFNYNQIGEDEYMVDLESDMDYVKGRSIAIASAVTSYARMTLYDIMKDVKNLGYEIHYTDTDSIITNCNIK